MKILSLVVFVISLSLLLLGWATSFRAGEPPSDRERLSAQLKQGNFKDAYEGFRKLALDPGADPGRAGGDLKQAVECLQRLGRIEESDGLIEAVVSIHPQGWRLLMAAAELYYEQLDHGGRMIAGKFHRGPGRDGGAHTGSFERDRVRALQLLVQGLAKARSAPERLEVGQYLGTLARVLLADRSETETWRLQSLTPLDVLPDYDANPYAWRWGRGPGTARGAPVNDRGGPVYYNLPQGFEKAANDGERWRWAMVQAIEANPALLNAMRLSFADFLLGEFGTQTVSGGPNVVVATPLPETGPESLHSLTDEETVARLATGIRRFKLPDEFNPIKIYQQIAADPKTGHGEDALNRLATIFENRQLFDRAAETWKQSKSVYGDRQYKQGRIDQILGAWGQFESQVSQAAGEGAKLQFLYRNGRLARFEAREVRTTRLLEDVKDYIASNPRQLEWQKTNIGNIGWRLIEANQRQYIGDVVASWDLPLDPPAGHFSRQLTVETPLKKAGAYLVTARLEGGNISRILVWLEDTVLLRKPLENRSYYLVADARTGRPAPGAELDLFGWRHVQVDGRNESRVEVKRLVGKSDGDGQLLVARSDVFDERSPYQWLVTARTEAGGRAFLGFSYAWIPGPTDPKYDHVGVYAMTDRPVYRPSSPVRFKLWVARATYGREGASEFAGQPFTAVVLNPKGEKVYEKSLVADAFGGIDGTFELGSDAGLGVYQVVIPDRGGGTFRVEEYKKPEFEVKVDAPARPVMLGEKVSATIKADYYFGSPVSEAKVKYKVTRTQADQRWYPVSRWDWLYGAGYWWFAGEASWYPGWAKWGCLRPLPPWWGRPQSPPEVVAEAEVPIRPDGTFPVEIDTALTKAVHPDQDHRYEITAEVTDLSRRTIVGSGQVLVARKPFSVTTWVDRGHYRVGDTIEVSIKAQTLDHRPVAGKGSLVLYRVSYDPAGKPTETQAERWDLTSDTDGDASQKIKASTAGQYRLSATIDDGHGHSIEGGYLFVIAGEGFDGSNFRFNDLEIVPDRKDYRPGDTVKLMINTNRADSTVLLFTRPVNGVYSPPKILRLRGKSTVETLAIASGDMPNLFVEAQTISGGKVHTEVREIAVPPESRVADIAVKPSSMTYKPGQKARVDVRLTGPDGKPFVGGTVLTVYDKAVDAIAGGSNVPDIREFFWKWKRNHGPQTESSLDRTESNLVKPGEVPMQPLGMNFFMPRAPGVFNGQRRAKGMGAMMGRLNEAMPMAAPASDGARARDMFDKMELQSAIRTEAVAAAPAPSMKPASAPAVQPAAQPVVRTNFADTAYWSAAVATRADGSATIEFPLPESLTSWKVKAWTLGEGTRVGQAEAEVVTSKDLMVRLQAPRFFVQKDEVVLSANVHNKLKSSKSVQVILELDGSVLEPLEESSRTVTIASGAEKRVDWRVKVAHEGRAIVRMKALTDEDSDAAQMNFPAYVHGMLKMEAFAGSIRPDRENAEVVLRVPIERRPEQTRLEVRYSPTLAGALVDALPYLADYPYGCTEQTLNRFLPTVITQKILIDLGVDLKTIRDKRTNLNSQELGDARERSRRWKGYEHNPVFDRDEVTRMANAGLKRLGDMQLSDGAWGWFSGYGEYPSAHLTALVVHGLQIARQDDLAVPDAMLQRGVDWLARYQAEQVRLLENAISNVQPSRSAAGDADALVFMVAADAGVRNEAMLGFLDRDRTKLSVYGKAVFGLALHKLGQGVGDKLAAVLENIGQYVVRDDENQTAYLKLPNQGYWWWWYGSEIETHAFVLKLLARTDPRGELAPRLVKYLLNNRRNGSYWNSTRDTAFCIEAMADYLKASGESRPDLTVAIAVDGKARKEVRITPAELFSFDNALVLEGKELDAGEHTISFTRRGNGPLYFNAYLTNFTLEDPIRHAGLEVKVDRKVYRLIRDDRSVDVAGGRGQAVAQRVERYRREPLADEASLKSGELVEVELEIDSKNDYEYLVFEDFKAAGFEPIEVRSGYNGNSLGAYVEYRDERVAFFVRNLGRGPHSVSYRLRAEVPGRFHALPARAQAMYAPELKANSDEIRLRVED